jgi:type II secretory pathway component GspD/PulD (secretin)
MKNGIQILTVFGLMTGMSLAQDNSSSVQAIMDELSKAQGVKPAAAPVVQPTAPVVKAAAPVSKPAPAVVKDAASVAQPASAMKAAAPVSKPAPAVVKDAAPVAQPAPVMKAVAPVAVAAAPQPAAPAAVDVPAVLEASREQYAAGEYDKAEAGFASVIAAEPENKIAAFFLRQFSERNHRVAEESAIKAVDQNWGMILRYYPVSERFVKGMGMEGVTGVTDVVPKFVAVDFPKGSSAVYLPDMKKLFVKNTPENLAKLEQVLSAFSENEESASAAQVKIETRFVEYSEGALQELGFNWSDSKTLDGKTFNSGDWSAVDGQDLFSGALRTVPFDQPGSIGVDSTVSSLGEIRATGNGTTTRIEDSFGTAAGSAGFTGKVGGKAIDMLIRALDQSSGVDVLSAPNVVTLSGQPAVITVGERHFYPQTYEAGESQGAVVHVKYADFEEKILGVEMTVTPTIKGNDIQMKINPKITELIGWQQFEISPKDTSYGTFQAKVTVQFEHERVIAKLPLFNRREVKTEVSVASGATIGMGGLIGEKNEAFSDRVPVLGSIPLVGRLFRSEGERAVKRNLMIFVTASKVAPSGRLISEKSFEK